MKNKDKKRIWKSIEHWKKMLAYTEKDFLSQEPLESPTSNHCALCLKYNNSWMLYSPSKRFDRCKGCPIANKTLKVFCRNTPYFESWAFFRFCRKTKDHSRLEKGLRDWKRAAQKEIDFLESLLK